MDPPEKRDNKGDVFMECGDLAFCEFAGRLLAQPVHGLFYAGQFLEWIEREFGWAERSGRRFMEVHDRFKSAKLADMQIDVSALYLIAEPKTPEPVRAQIITCAGNALPLASLDRQLGGTCKIHFQKGTEGDQACAG